MSEPTNQMIILEEQPLRAQARSLADAATELRTVDASITSSSNAGAFGALCGALLAPAIARTAQQTRDHASTAAQLAHAMSNAVTQAADAFDSVEASAVQTFGGMDGGAK